MAPAIFHFFFSFRHIYVDHDIEHWVLDFLLLGPYFLSYLVSLNFNFNFNFTNILNFNFTDAHLFNFCSSNSRV